MTGMTASAGMAAISTSCRRRLRRGAPCGRPARLRPLSLIVIILLPLASESWAEAGQRHRWWESGEIRAELDISEDQSLAIEEIYASTVPALRSLMQALDAEGQELSRMIADMNVAEWELTLQIDKVEAARSALSKKRILMLYQMRKELTPTQREALRSIERRRREERASNRRR